MSSDILVNNSLPDKTRTRGIDISDQEIHKQSKPQKAVFYGYIIVAAAFLIMMVTYGAVFTFGVFFKPLSEEFGWTRAMTSSAYSLSVFVHGLFYVVMGKLNDKFGPRIVISICGFFLGLGYLLMSEVNAIWQLYLFYGVIIGVGMTSYLPLASTVARWFLRRRGMMTGVVLAGAGVGTMVMPPVAQWLISDYAWRDSYRIIGAIALVLMIFTAQFLKRAPSQMNQGKPASDTADRDHRTSATSSIPFMQAVRLKNFWLLLGVLFSQRFIIQAIMVHIVPYAMDHGTSAAMAASVLTIIGGVSVSGRLAMGGLSDRIGSRPSFALCFVGMSAALFILLALPQLWPLYLFAVAFGFTYGGMYTLASPLAAELFGLASHGLILGVISFGGTIGGALSPTLVGYIFDISDSYWLGFLACAAVGIFGLSLTLAMRPTPKEMHR